MSFFVVTPLAFLVTIYLIFKFMDSLAEGEHEMLKFGLGGFALVCGYQMWLMVADINQEASGSLPGLEDMVGNFVWVYGTIMVIILSYFLYNIIIRYLDWRNWKKNKNPFENTERRYFK